MSVCAFTSVCGEDASWLPQYLAEVERLRVPFVMHFDRCVLRDALAHPLMVGVTTQTNQAKEFSECDKQQPLDLVAALGYEWALAWDVDETWSRDAREHLDRLGEFTADLLTCQWVNLWGDDEHVRTDGAFAASYRCKLYRMRPDRWKFTHAIVNGAVDLTGRHQNGMEQRTGLVCIHHGLKTPELRRLHRERWDRIYSSHVGKNPYKTWAWACDESIEPGIEPNVWS